MSVLYWANIISNIEQIVRRGCEVDGRGRTGGCLCIARPDGMPVAVFLIGDVPDTDAAVRYWTFCQEKARRLGQNPGHVSSWQTRSVSEKKYGGAVRNEVYYIFSFSGLSEHLDEAVAAKVAKELNACLMDWQQVDRIIKESGNTQIAGFLV